MVSSAQGEYHQPKHDDCRVLIRHCPNARPLEKRETALNKPAIAIVFVFVALLGLYFVYEGRYDQGVADGRFAQCQGDQNIIASTYPPGEQTSLFCMMNYGGDATTLGLLLIVISVAALAYVSLVEPKASPVSSAPPAS